MILVIMPQAAFKLPCKLPPGRASATRQWPGTHWHRDWQAGAAQALALATQGQAGTGNLKNAGPPPKASASCPAVSSRNCHGHCSMRWIGFSASLTRPGAGPHDPTGTSRRIRLGPPARAASGCRAAGARWRPTTDICCFQRSHWRYWGYVTSRSRDASESADMAK
jgi:hypothetical protein